MDNITTLKIDTETFARLALSRWKSVTKDMYFTSKGAEDTFKSFFLMGYDSAWHDMHDLSTGLHDLDDILKERT